MSVDRVRQSLENLRLAAEEWALKRKTKEESPTEEHLRLSRELLQEIKEQEQREAADRYWAEYMRQSLSQTALSDVYTFNQRLTATNTDYIFSWRVLV